MKTMYCSVNSAETKAKREKKLEHFFREAYAVTFGLDKSTKSKVNIKQIYFFLFKNRIC